MASVGPNHEVGLIRELVAHARVPPRDSVRLTHNERVRQREGAVELIAR
jgi:hypothetical protein